MIMQPHLAALQDSLRSDYTVLLAWDDPSPELQAQVRALIAGDGFVSEKDWLESLPRLGLIAAFTSGYEGVDLAWARSRGLAVSHAQDANHEDVADHALGLILGARRQIVAGDRSVRAGQSSPTGRMLTASMAGQRVGIVGLGRIGRALAMRCDALRLQVTWWAPREQPDAQWARAASLLELARESDILVVACRADESTRGLIGREVIDALGSAGLLVNIARGQLLDEDEVIAALHDRRLGGAALDVFLREPPSAARWADVPRTVLTPHTAGATYQAVQSMLGQLQANLAAFFAGQPLLSPAWEPPRGA